MSNIVFAIAAWALNARIHPAAIAALKFDLTTDPDFTIDPQAINPQAINPQANTPSYRFVH